MGFWSYFMCVLKMEILCWKSGGYTMFGFRLKVVGTIISIAKSIILSNTSERKKYELFAMSVEI